MLTTYRLSLNLAFYLGNNSTERIKIFKTIKEAYKLRSKIVHGCKIDTKKLDNTYLIIEEYLRRSLVKILTGKQGKEKKHLLDYVNERIFGIS